MEGGTERKREREKERPPHSGEWKRGEDLQSELNRFLFSEDRGTANVKNVIERDINGGK